MEKNETKTKKKTAGNDPFLKIVKRLFNVPIFQKTSAIMNAEGAAASITYVQTHLVRPIIEVEEFSRVEMYIMDARAVALRGTKTIIHEEALAQNELRLAAVRAAEAVRIIEEALAMNEGKEEARRAFEEQMDEEAKDEGMMEAAHEEALEDNADRGIDIPETPVPGLTYGASHWVSADGGRRWIAGRTRPDLTLMDSIDADDHDAAVRGEITAEEIIDRINELIQNGG